jgi:hypothetical protein
LSATVTRKNPNALKALQERFAAVGKLEVAAGYPKGKAQAYPDGESVIDIAIKNCFGIGVPQRDFMTYAKILIGRDATIKKIMMAVAKETADPKGSVQVVKSLQEAAGMQAVTLIQNAIQEGTWEPNSKATIAKKGSSQPLVDTKHMTNSTTYVVREKS